MAASPDYHAHDRPRKGFALLAAVVLVAVIAVLSTIITVNLTGDNDAKRIAQVADILKRLEIETDSTSPAFRAQVARLPGRLSHLGRRIVSTDLNPCGTAYGTAAANWVGPYHIFPMTGGSYFIAQGFIANDALVRVPTGASPAAGTLAIVIPGVSRSDAQALGVVVDGTNSGTGKYVKFPATGDPVTVEYQNPVAAGC